MALARTLASSLLSCLALRYAAALVQIFFLIAISAPSASSTNFSFPNFQADVAAVAAAATAAATAATKIVIKGDAAYGGDGTIKLTKNLSSAGQAVYHEPVPLWDSSSAAAGGDPADFATHFSFKIGVLDNATCCGDGIAFFLSQFPSEIPPRSNASNLGLFNYSLDGSGMEHVVAVEFDTFQNIPWNDPSDNHIGIDVHKIFSLATVDLNTSMKQGLVADAWITYNGSTKNLTVFLSYRDLNKSWALSQVVDLSKNLPEEVAVGFSASTGGNQESHVLLSWNFTSTLRMSAAESNKTGRDVGFGIGIGVAVLVSVASILACCVWPGRRDRRRKQKEEDAAAINLSIGDAFDRRGGPRRFPYTQLSAATKNFSEEQMLGKGGFGEVYRGELGNPKVTMAIKKISSSSKQGKKEYIAEVTIISQLRHRNLVQLIGYCHEKGDLLLVYEFMPNGSLDMHLYGEDCVLRWPERHKIVLGLASALLYLHEECEQCVVHRDIKPSNLMLDSDFNPKLGDFGLAKLVDHDRGSLTTVWAGTKGYMAPEYCTPTGKACRESDIFSFGVVTLEIACGRKPIERRDNSDEVNLVQWVWDHYGRKTLLAAADGRLEMDFDEQRMERMMAVGLWCAHPDCTQRPSIRQALNALNFDAGLPDLPSRMPVPSFMQPQIRDSSHSTNPPCSPENASASNSGSLISNSAMLGR